MNSFKSGSGNLDFDSDEDRGNDAGSDQSQSSPDAEENTAEKSQSTGTTESQTDSSVETPPADQKREYPYSVRRSNVTDERDVRLEAHVRERVASSEASFRSELAAALETDDISKTDAREFALLYAFQNPEDVAALMRDEGFGVLD